MVVYMAQTVCYVLCSHRRVSVFKVVHGGGEFVIYEFILFYNFYLKQERS